MGITKVKPNELDKRYFNLMDDQESNNGVYALFEQYESQPVVSYGKSIKELHSRLDFIGDAFYTPNKFKSWNMGKENLLTLNSAFIDIDLEKGVHLDPAHKINIWEMILKESKLPRPTVVVDSGNGMHIYYLLKKPIQDNSQIGQFKRMLERINQVYAQKINEAIKNTVNIPLYADMAATNSNRLLRLPATKNGTKTSHVIQFNPNDRYSVNELLEPLPDYDKSKTRAYNQAKYGKKSDDNQILYISNIKRLNKNRVNDLFKLAELRNYNLGNQRNNFFHILTSQAMHREIELHAWLPEVYELNNQLTDPLSEKELQTIINSSEKGMYLYRNSTLTEKLDITDAEINELITIRRTSRRERREQARAERKNRNELINQLHQRGMSITNIAKEVGVSRPTVYNNLKK